MSLNWQWTDKMGECEYDSGHVSNLYRGNAFVIAVNEFPNDTYSLAWFAADETHIKNQLGLTKGYDNCFKEFGIKSLRLDTKYTETAKLCQMLARSKTPIQITLY